MSNFDAVMPKSSLGAYKEAWMNEEATPKKRSGFHQLGMKDK